MLGVFRYADLFLGLALTSVHVGAGRSPSVVDLPVARDAFGLPYIPSSSLKGSVKSLCMLRWCARLCEKLYGWDIRVRGETPDQPYASPVVFTDAHVLFYPARIEFEEGLAYGYVTSHLLLDLFSSQLWDYSRLYCDARPRFEEMVSLMQRIRDHGAEVRDIVVNGVYVKEAGVVEGGDLCTGLMGGGVSAASRLCSMILVLDDDSFASIVDAGMVRVTRVRLDYRRKVVEQGALWTEEYVPELTVYWFHTLYRDTVTDQGEEVKAAEARREHLRLLRETGYTLVVGGRETIGKGIIRLYHALGGDTA